MIDPILSAFSSSPYYWAIMNALNQNNSQTFARHSAPDTLAYAPSDVTASDIYGPYGTPMDFGGNLPAGNGFAGGIIPWGAGGGAGGLTGAGPGTAGDATGFGGPGFSSPDVSAPAAPSGFPGWGGLSDPAAPNNGFNTGAPAVSVNPDSTPGKGVSVVGNPAAPSPTPNSVVADVFNGMPSPSQPSPVAIAPDDENVDPGDLSSPSPGPALAGLPADFTSDPGALGFSGLSAGVLGGNSLGGLAAANAAANHSAVNPGSFYGGLFNDNNDQAAAQTASPAPSGFLSQGFNSIANDVAAAIAGLMGNSQQSNDPASTTAAVGMLNAPGYVNDSMSTMNDVSNAMAENAVNGFNSAPGFSSISNATGLPGGLMGIGMMGDMTGGVLADGGLTGTGYGGVGLGAISGAPAAAPDVGFSGMNTGGAFGNSGLGFGITGGPGFGGQQASDPGGYNVDSASNMGPGFTGFSSDNDASDAASAAASASASVGFGGLGAMGDSGDVTGGEGVTGDAAAAADASGGDAAGDGGDGGDGGSSGGDGGW